MAQNTGFVGRARAASTSLANASPQLGMWQAAGTAIAQAPNLTELREPDSGGSNIEFDAHGHSARLAKPDTNGSLVLVRSQTRVFEETPRSTKDEDATHVTSKHPHLDRHRAHLRSLHERHKSDVKEKWGLTIMHGFTAFWKFFKTPSGFFIIIYFLNIVVRRVVKLSAARVNKTRPGAPCSSFCC